MTDKNKEKKKADRKKVPEKPLPKCRLCNKDPFHCKCGTWEDLDK